MALVFVACGILFSCSKGDEPSPVAASAPIITVQQKQVNVYGGAVLTIVSNELRIGDELVASWTQKNNEKCDVLVTV